LKIRFPGYSIVQDCSSNERFPELYQKKHIISCFILNPRLIVLIAKIRYKMTPKDIIIGAFSWLIASKSGCFG